MTAKHLGCILLGPLLLALSACEVSVRRCNKDAGDCDFSFDEDVDSGDGTDGGAGADGGEQDATTGGDGGEVTEDAGSQGDAGLDSGFVGEPLTLEQLCDALSSRRLEWSTAFESLECCSLSEASGPEAEAILNLFGADNAAEGCIQSRQALIDRGKITYHPEYAGACVEAFLQHIEAAPTECVEGGFDVWALAARIGHGAPALAQIPACRAAMAGTVPADGECTEDFECSNQLRCRAGYGGGAQTTKTCQAPLTSGGCTKDADCVLGYTCVGSDASGGRTCTNVLASVGNCSRHVECEVGKLCTVVDTVNGKDVKQCRAPTFSDAICAPQP